MELRSPDPACNPYLSFALLIEAGLEGIEKELVLPAPTDRNLYSGEQEDLPTLPQSLSEAVELAQESDLVKRVLPEGIRQKYLDLKRKEAQQAETAEHAFERQKALYFGVL